MNKTHTTIKAVKATKRKESWRVFGCSIRWMQMKIDDPNSSQDNNNKHNCSFYFNEFEKVNLYVIRN